jgi:hypothetical protein
MFGKLLNTMSKIPLIGRLFRGGAAAEGGKQGMGIMTKLGLGTGAVVAADQIVGDGSVTLAAGHKIGQTGESVLGLYNRYANTGLNNIKALDLNLAEQSTSMGFFNTINGFLFSLCDFLGFDKQAEFFKDRMVDTTEEIFEHIDDQREMLDGHGNVRRERFTEAQVEAGVGVRGVDQASFDTPAIDAGEVSPLSAFGSVAYGVEQGAVSMVTGVTSLVSGTYEALTTDKSFVSSFSDDFNSQNAYVMSRLEGLHGKPTIDTPLEENLNLGGQFASWLVPIGFAAKATGSIVSGLANIAPKALPEVQAMKLAMH